MKNIFKKTYKGPAGNHLGWLTKKTQFGEPREVNMSIHPGRKVYGRLYDPHKHEEHKDDYPARDNA